MASSPCRNNILPIDYKKQIDCRKCPIRRSTLFGNLAVEDSQLIKNRRHNQLKLKSKTTLFVQNSSPEYIYVVQDGWMILSVSNAQGKRQILRFVLPGEFIGLNTNSEGKVMYSASSLTPVTLCTFYRDDVTDLIFSNKAVANRFMFMNAQDASLSHQQIVNGCQKSATERVAALLMEFFYRCYPHGRSTRQASGFKLPFPLTQEEIGDAVGLTNVHVNRVMQGFKQQGIIDCKNKHVIICNLDKLDSLADFNHSLLN